MRFPEEPTTSVYFTPIAQLILLVFLFLSLLFSITELTLFCVIMLLVGVGTYLWSRVCRRGVSCRIEVDKKRLFPGQTLNIGIHVVNNKFLPTLVKIKLPINAALAGIDHGQALTEQVGLLWYQKLYFSKAFQAQERGVYRLGPPYLRIGDLLGFFPKEKDGDGDLTLVVYPRIVPLKPLQLQRREIFGAPGGTGPVEDPILLYGVRDYQPGSPARRILWKASARQDKLQEKLCEPAEQEKLLIVVDVAGFEERQAVDSFERALEVAASLAVSMDRKGVAIGLVTNGMVAGGGPRILPISKSAQQIVAVLEVLARLNMRSDRSVCDILARGYALPWGVSALFLTHTLCDQARQTVAYFQARKIPLRIADAQTVAEEIHCGVPKGAGGIEREAA